MKRIFAIIASLALAFTAYAQERTTEEIVADVLAAMPAQNSYDFNEQMKALADAAPQSIVDVARMMKPAGEGVKNNIYEYALSGVVAYVTDPAHKEKETSVLMGLQQAAANCSDETNKAFIESLERYLKPEENPLIPFDLVKEPKKTDPVQDKCSAAYICMQAYSESKGMKILKEALKDEDIQYRNAVLGYATDKYGVEKLAPTLIKEYSKASDGAKVDLLNWFGNNKVEQAVDVVSGAMEESGEVAAVAIRAAGKIGGERLGKELVGILGSSDAEKSAEALTALKSFKGDIQDEVVEAMGSSSSVEGLMDLASARRMSKAYPVIFRNYQSGDAAAAKYLSGVVGMQNIQEIGDALASAGSNVPELQNALYSCIHTLAPQEQYSQVKSLIDKAPAKENFYAVLARTGTDAAVDDLYRAYSGGSQAALQGLVSIDNASAAPILMNIAKSDASRIGTVLPRYIDLVDTYEQDMDAKCDDLKAAMDIADGKDLKTSALNALSGVPTKKAFMLAGQYLDDGDVAYSAANAVKNIANKSAEKIGYSELKAYLDKASKIFSSTGNADDGYAVSEIETILSKAEASAENE